MARRTFQDGGQAYILLSYDNGDFVFKRSSNRKALAQKILARGDAVAGRAGSMVWVSAETLGNDLWVATGDRTPTTNNAILQHEANTRRLADFESRLGRSILSFGIELPLGANVFATNGAFAFTNQGRFVTGSIRLLQPNSKNRIPFEVEWQERLPAGTVSLSVQSRGELAAQTMLPTQFEMAEVDKDGRKHRLGTAEVLEAKVSRGALPKRAFAIEESVSGGFRALIVRDNDSLRPKAVGEAFGTRKVYLAGYMVPPQLIRGITLGFMVVASVAFATAVFVRSKAKKTTILKEQ